MPLDPAILAAFVVAALALVVSPGPDTMLILRYTLASGQRVGLATVAGVQLGLIVHTLAAVAGLSLLIVSVPAVFRAVALTGAAYLAWLAVQSFRAGVMHVSQADGDGIGWSKALRDAALTNILNPKVIVLFLALMPGFLQPERGNIPLQLVTLGATLIAVNVVWQTAHTLAAEWTRHWMSDPKVHRIIAWATGAVFLLFAGLMAWEHGLR